MIAIIFIAAISLYIGYITWRSDYDRGYYKGYATRGLGTIFFVAGMCAGVLFVIVGLLGNIWIDAPVKEGDFQRIVSLRDNASVDGSFSLGIGSIDGKMKYSTYVKLEEGTFRLKQFDSESTKIKQSDEVEPRVAKLTQTNFWGNFWIYALPRSRGHLITVPEGAIIENFELDGA